MSKFIEILKNNLNTIYITVISGVLIAAISGIMIWLCFTVSENSKDIVVLKALQ